MRYLLIYTDDPSLASGWDDEARASAYSWIEEVNRSGVGLQGSPVRPTADATTIKIRDGELIITDGPYAETKDVVMGFSIIAAADLDEAVALTKGHPIFDEGGAIEIRPILKL